MRYGLDSVDIQLGLRDLDLSGIFDRMVERLRIGSLAMAAFSCRT